MLLIRPFDVVRAAAADDQVASLRLSIDNPDQSRD